jgi:hypothetical protein
LFDLYMNPAITQFDIIQSKLATTTIKKKYLMLIYEITILNFYVYIILKELNIIASNHNSLNKHCYMIKYENLTLKIYIRNISKFIPISLTSWFGLMTDAALRKSGFLIINFNGNDFRHNYQKLLIKKLLK